MHPRISEVLSYLDTQHRALAEAVGAVPPARQMQRPAADCWSVADVLGHLAVVEELITGVLRTRIAAAREKGVGPELETSPIVPTVDIDRVLDRTRRITAAPEWLGPAETDGATAWARLESAHAALREVISAADGLSLCHVGARNPLLGPLNAYQWVVFMGAHEARHTAQIREIAAALEEAARTTGVTPA
jgi:hypothetical protein